MREKQEVFKIIAIKYEKCDKKVLKICLRITDR